MRGVGAVGTKRALANRAAAGCAAVALGALLAACSSLPSSPSSPPAAGAPAERLPQPRRDADSGSRNATAAGAQGSPSPRPGPRGGGYYKDDGPEDSPPSDLDRVRDPAPRWEPLHRFANRPYTVFGRNYVPATSLRPYRERGIASWYGRKFHGQPTSVGEVYDMYAMTAAHPTLPLPSYARVSNPANGRSVIVRINDRGPFHPGRIVDLSYTAAYKLGILQRGSAEVEVESILFGMEDLLSPLPEVAATESLPVELPLRTDSGGVFVQIGAFANNANAENFLSHVANQLAAAGVQARVRQSQGMYRVLAGPYGDRATAMDASERVRRVIGVNGTIRVD